MRCPFVDKLEGRRLAILLCCSEKMTCLTNMTIYFYHTFRQKMKVCDHVKRKNQIVFYTVKGSTIKNFLIIDMIMGTGIYYVVKMISTSVLMGMIGSYVGSEGIKRIPKFAKNK
ncbi:hypothetical protein [Peribacillus sp. NPDC097295]|uniref:hypothetical protein n=1 Tax=Peribacillus sp. NPDC097295 TaxID=3364402 RepID=UPI00381544F2